MKTSNVGDSEDWGEWGEDFDLPQVRHLEKAGVEGSVSNFNFLTRPMHIQPTAAMKSKPQYSQKKGE